MDCYICQNECICIEHKNFSQNPLIKNWYPEKVGACSHSFCEECMHGWLVNCLTSGLDFSCPVCRFVYLSWDRLYHAYELYQCFGERREKLIGQR